MLRDLVEKKHYKFAKNAKNWQEAIRMSCESLEADGTVEPNYKEEIIKFVGGHGPYIVIMPNVAMPHSQENVEGVNRTDMAFMKLDEPVSFEEGNPDMDVQLFFTLASNDHSQHLDNMHKVVELLMNEGIIPALIEAQSPEDLIKIQETMLD